MEKTDVGVKNLKFSCRVVRLWEGGLGPLDTSNIVPPHTNRKGFIRMIGGTPRMNLSFLCSHEIPKAHITRDLFQPAFGNSVNSGVFSGLRFPPENRTSLTMLLCSEKGIGYPLNYIVSTNHVLNLKIFNSYVRTTRVN